MPRVGRIVVEGYPHHVVQRGNNRESVFFDEKDRREYLNLLQKYTQKWGCPVLAYCLMPNHVHLLVIPERENSLSKTMQGIALCYTQYINKKYHKSGRLWESRYYSCAVDRENCLWMVARYIEQNPKRAGLVQREEGYFYSSARAHITEVPDRVLGGRIFEEEGRSEYIGFLSGALNDDEIEKIRSCTRTSLPFGNEIFVKAIGQGLGRDLERKPRGRPRKRLLNI